MEAGGVPVAKLTEVEIVTIQGLKAKGEGQSAIARLMDVTEGTVRYHLRRAREGATDGRKKPFLVERLGLDAVARLWWETERARLGAARPPSVQEFHEYLMLEHEYSGSYKSVRKYARKAFPRPKRRPFRRVETPPGAQSQSDWAERTVDIGDPGGPTKLYAFVMVLSHSRRRVVIWSRACNQLAWHRVHNEAYARLDGVAAVNRIDNLKTGVSRGAGPWGTINRSYRTYARHLHFHVDPHEPRQPQQKGKVERAVRVLERLQLGKRCFESLEHLQTWTDARLETIDEQRICPATGKTVCESWQAEKPFLAPLPETMPEPFDLVKSCPVHKDCTIRCEGRTYAVPFAHVGKIVEVHGCAETIRIFDPDGGKLLIAYPRRSQERILVPPHCYEGASTADVTAPRPLGRLGRRMQQLAEMPVETRPVDLYAALAEAVRP